MGELYSLLALAATCQEEAGWVPSQFGPSGGKTIYVALYDVHMGWACTENG
jgi:hypothetical protein